jgi:hypothetical protein
MTTTTRNLYSVLSLAPAVLLIAYLVTFMMLFIGMFHEIEAFEDGTAETFSFAGWGPVIITGVLMAITGLTALVLFVRHVISNKSLPETERVVWILVLIFAGFIGFPLYWFMRGIKYERDSSLPAMTS